MASASQFDRHIKRTRSLDPLIDGRDDRMVNTMFFMGKSATGTTTVKTIQRRRKRHGQPDDQRSMCVFPAK